MNEKEKEPSVSSTSKFTDIVQEVIDQTKVDQSSVIGESEASGTDQTEDLKNGESPEDGQETTQAEEINPTDSQEQVSGDTKDSTTEQAADVEPV